MNKESRIIGNIRAINKQVLRSIETEFDVIITNNPELRDELDGCYRRVRQHVLNSVGDCVRACKRDLDGD